MRWFTCLTASVALMLALFSLEPWRAAYGDAALERITVDRTEGRAGDHATITGTDLVVEGETTQVIFAETMVATIISQSATQLVVEVPPNAYSWRVKVKVGAREVMSDKPFLVKKTVTRTQTFIGRGPAEVEEEIIVRKTAKRLIPTVFGGGKKMVDVEVMEGDVTAPKIEEISLTSGEPGTIVTIDGSNFVIKGRPQSLIGAGPIAPVTRRISAVTFNGIPAERVWIDGPNRIRASVPMGAATGKIRVEREGFDTGGNTLLAANEIDFTVTAAPQLVADALPQIESYGEQVVARGQVLTIVGKNFKRNGVETRVMFGSKLGEVVSNDGKVLKVRTPHQGGGYFKPRVMVGGHAVDATEEIAVYQVKHWGPIQGSKPGRYYFVGRTVPAGFESKIEWSSTGKPSKYKGRIYRLRLPGGSMRPIGQVFVKGGSIAFFSNCGNFLVSKTTFIIDEPTTPGDLNDYRDADMAIFKTVTPRLKILFPQDIETGWDVWLDNGLDEVSGSEIDDVEITDLFEIEPGNPRNLILKSAYASGIPATFPLSGGPITFPANNSRDVIIPGGGSPVDGFLFREGSNRIQAMSSGGPGAAAGVAEQLCYTDPGEPLFIVDPQFTWVTVGDRTFIQNRMLFAIEETARAEAEDIFELELDDKEISEVCQRNGIVPIAGVPEQGVFSGQARFSGTDSEFVQEVADIVAAESNVAAGIVEFQIGTDNHVTESWPASYRGAARKAETGGVDAGPFDNNPNDTQDNDGVLIWMKRHFPMFTFAGHRLMEFETRTVPTLNVAVIDSGFGDDLRPDMVTPGNVNLSSDFTPARAFTRLSDQGVGPAVEVGGTDAGTDGALWNELSDLGNHGTMTVHAALGNGTRILGISRDQGVHAIRLTVGGPGATHRAVNLAATAPGMGIISMSMGSQVNLTAAERAAIRLIFIPALRNIRHNGKIWAASAGNFRPAGGNADERSYTFMAQAAPRTQGTAGNLIVPVAAVAFDHRAGTPETVTFYSNPGTTISVAGPSGTGVGGAQNLVSMENDEDAGGVLPLRQSAGGTSHATPVVAGLLGAMMQLDDFRIDEDAGRNPPDPHPVDGRVEREERALKIVEMMEGTADDPGNPRVPFAGTPPRNNDVGWGRINAWKALLAVANNGFALNKDSGGVDYFPQVSTLPARNGMTPAQTRWYGFVVRTNVKNAQLWANGAQLLDVGNTNSPTGNTQILAHKGVTRGTELNHSVAVGAVNQTAADITANRLTKVSIDREGNVVTIAGHRGAVAANDLVRVVQQRWNNGNDSDAVNDDIVFPGAAGQAVDTNGGFTMMWNFGAAPYAPGDLNIADLFEVQVRVGGAGAWLPLCMRRLGGDTGAEGDRTHDTQYILTTSIRRSFLDTITDLEVREPDGTTVIATLDVSPMTTLHVAAPPATGDGTSSGIKELVFDDFVIDFTANKRVVNLEFDRNGEAAGEETGPGTILVHNVDNDDTDATVDIDDANGVAGEDDLKRLQMLLGPEVPRDGTVTIEILAGFDKIRVYTDPQKGAGTLLLDNATRSVNWVLTGVPARQDFAEAVNKGLWVEGLALTDFQDEAQLRLTYDDGVVSTDDVHITVIGMVDIDVDTNHDSTIDDGNDMNNDASETSEDRIENNAPGRMVMLNVDDDDANGVADNRGGDALTIQANDADDLLDLILREVPANMNHNGHSIRLFVDPADEHKIRIFNDAMPAVIVMGKDAGGVGVDTNTYPVPWAGIGAGELTYKIEGVETGTVTLKIEYIDGVPAVIDEDILQIHVANIDIDADLDFDGNKNDTDEDLEGVLPGLILPVNEDDDDPKKVPATGIDNANAVIDDDAPNNRTDDDVVDLIIRHDVDLIADAGYTVGLSIPAGNVTDIRIFDQNGVAKLGKDGGGIGVNVDSYTIPFNDITGGADLTYKMEGITAGAQVDLTIKYERDPGGMAPILLLSEDMIRITIVNAMDLDGDTNNNGAINAANNGDDDPFENDVFAEATPGVILVLNDDDDDDNGVVDNGGADAGAIQANNPQGEDDADDLVDLILRQAANLEQNGLTVELSVPGVDQNKIRIFDQNGAPILGPAPQAATYVVPFVGPGITTQQLDYKMEGLATGDVTITLAYKLGNNVVHEDKLNVKIVGPIDMDMDSNSDGVIDANNDDDDDPIENLQNETGILIPVNIDDDNKDGVIDNTNIIVDNPIGLADDENDMVDLISRKAANLVNGDYSVWIKIDDPTAIRIFDATTLAFVLGAGDGGAQADVPEVDLGVVNIGNADLTGLVEAVLVNKNVVVSLEYRKNLGGGMFHVIRKDEVKIKTISAMDLDVDSNNECTIHADNAFDNDGEDDDPIEMDAPGRLIGISKTTDALALQQANEADLMLRQAATLEQGIDFTAVLYVAAGDAAKLTVLDGGATERIGVGAAGADAYTVPFAGLTAPGDLTYKIRGRDTGNVTITLEYRKNKAGGGFHVIHKDELTVRFVGLDIDVDSDNDNTFEGTDDTNEMTAPGRLVMVNDDDDNTDSTADNVDTTINGAADKSDLILLKIRKETNLDAVGKVELSVSAADAAKIRVFDDGDTAVLGKGVNAGADALTYTVPFADITGAQDLDYRVEGFDATAASSEVTILIKYFNAMDDTCVLAQDELVITPVELDGVGAADTSTTRALHSPSTGSDPVGDIDMIHYGTPKGIGDSRLLIGIVPNTTAVKNHIDWFGTGFTEQTNPLEAKVSRASAAEKTGGFNLAGKTWRDVKVWVIWSTFETPTAKSINVDTSNDELKVDTGYDFVAQLLPNSIIDATNRPVLTGSSSVDPPAEAEPGDDICGTPLEDGATVKWDVSRQMRSKVVTGPSDTGTKATGSITTIAGSVLADEETFTLTERAGVSHVFEFDLEDDGVTPGRVEIDIDGINDTADDVRDAIITAIQGVSQFEVTATNGGAATVSLENDRFGDEGNVTITDTVNNAGFTTSGMSGGDDGDWRGSPACFFVPIIAYPADIVESGQLDKRVGNADAEVSDEDNNPYDVSPALYKVTSGKAYTAGVTDTSGIDDDTIEFRLHFQEYVRVLLSGVWFDISDFEEWKIHYKFKKVSGAWANDGTLRENNNTGF